VIPYLRVTFSHSEGRGRCLGHKLVWMGFRGPIPNGLEIDHVDGDKSNNALTNLEPVTSGENQRRSWKLGLHKPRTPVNRACSDAVLQEVRSRLASGERQSSIADDLGLSRGVVNRIAKGKTYASSREDATASP